MAIQTQGSVLSVETALATTKAITGVSQATEAIVTATAHGYGDGNIIKVANVSGMPQMNNRAFQVDAVAGSPMTNKFGLKGVDSTLYTPWTSGGDTYKATMTAIGGISGAPNLFQGTAPTVDVTNLLSVAQEFVMGLQNVGNASLAVIFDDADAGQTVLQQAKEAAIPKVFSVKLKNGKISTFLAYVTSFSLAVPQNEVVRATVDLLLAGAPTRFV